MERMGGAGAAITAELLPTAHIGSSSEGRAELRRYSFFLRAADVGELLGCFLRVECGLMSVSGGDFRVQCALFVVAGFVVLGLSRAE